MKCFILPNFADPDGVPEYLAERLADAVVHALYIVDSDTFPYGLPFAHADTVSLFDAVCHPEPLTYCERHGNYFPVADVVVHQQRDRHPEPVAHAIGFLDSISQPEPLEHSERHRISFTATDAIKHEQHHRYIKPVTDAIPDAVVNAEHVACPICADV